MTGEKLTMKYNDIKQLISAKWHNRVQINLSDDYLCEVICRQPELVPEISRELFEQGDLSFAGLVVEETSEQWTLRYIFYICDIGAGQIHLITSKPLNDKSFASIADYIHAADWHEREVEDLFGLVFTGHPRLGDFILHDDAWQEGLEPMRHNFDIAKALRQRRPAEDWRPHRIVQETGAFVMPIGPKFSGLSEPVHMLLETVGEDVIRATPRLFYKWRAVEKLSEGKTANDVLLIAERFAGTTAFAHGMAFCQAIEKICGCHITQRAAFLRVFIAELERLRHHIGAIRAICGSTGLAVAESQAAIFEEQMLRISNELTGHRYLFGILACGGLLHNLEDNACTQAFTGSQQIVKQLLSLEKLLRNTSSFLDRLEEVGIVPTAIAKNYGLQGPIARASGIAGDLRKVQPYSGYNNFEFNLPCEQEGDGYARLRVLFAEIVQSIRIMEQVLKSLPGGAVSSPCGYRQGAALGWTEAPRGGAFHWVKIDQNGKIIRYRIMPPSFANWHGFHLTVENFAFQDLPIMLSTFDLSVAENDR